MKKLVFLLIVSMLALSLASCAKKPGPRMTAEDSMRIGMDYFKRGKYEAAAPMFENSLMEADNPKMASKAQLFLADSYFFNKNYAEAIPAYEQFLDIYGETEDANVAQLRLGLSYYAQVDTIDRDMSAAEGALKAFTKLRAKSPAFTRQFKLNAKIVELRGMLADRELYVAKFYFRTNHPESAEKRLKYLINRYPDTNAYAEGLYVYANWLAKQKGREADAIKYYQKLIKERPDSKYTLEVAKDLTNLLAKITNELAEKQAQEKAKAKKQEK